MSRRDVILLEGAKCKAAFNALPIHEQKSLARQVRTISGGKK